MSPRINLIEDQNWIDDRKISGSTTKIDLKYCKFQIHKKEVLSDSSVVTIFPDGKTAWALRISNQDNIREAESQGYSGPDAVWKSLVEHEFLHSLVSEILYDRPSLVLETESGRKFHPSWLRYQEEAIVIGMQFLLNSQSPWLNFEDPLIKETYDLIGTVTQLPSDLISHCTVSIKSLWSQIEKDSK